MIYKWVIILLLTLLSNTFTTCVLPVSNKVKECWKIKKENGKTNLLTLLLPSMHVQFFAWISLDLFLVGSKCYYINSPPSNCMFLILCNLGKAQNDRYVHFCLTFACKSLSLCSLVVVVLVYPVINQHRIILFRSGSIIISLCCVPSVSNILV